MADKNPTLKEMLASQRRIDHNINGTTEVEAEETEETEEEEQEEEEETSTSDLTVAQLKEALDAAEIAYPSDARKADLVELYDANELGTAEE